VWDPQASRVPILLELLRNLVYISESVWFICSTADVLSECLSGDGHDKKLKSSTLTMQHSQRPDYEP
jgi:hypothetical protein